MSNRFDLKVIIKSEEKIYDVKCLFRKLENEDFHRVFLERPLVKEQSKNYRVDGKNIILIQCTSVLDCNDKPIFESNVVKVFDLKGNYKLYAVVWDDCDSSFFLRNKNGYKSFHCCLCMEIIGNYHLNPKLLKNEK